MVFITPTSDRQDGNLAIEERQNHGLLLNRQKANHSKLTGEDAFPQGNNPTSNGLTTTDAEHGQGQSSTIGHYAAGTITKEGLNRTKNAIRTGHREESTPAVECIEILDDEDEEDDDVRVIEEPMPKRARTGTPQSETVQSQRRETSNKSPVPEDPKNSKESTPIRAAASIKTISLTSTPAKKDPNESVASPSAAEQQNQAKLTSYSALLERLNEYVKDIIDKGENLERKVLDVLLSAINVQVQKEPYSVRKLILEKQLVLPNTISFPPSQVVDMVIEHDPDHQLSRVISRLFGEERPKLTDNERKERQMLKAMNAAPNMTKLLLEIGQDLVQESTYYDIVHAKNLPEMPKNMETYKQVAAQLKPVWEALKEKNSPHKLKTFTCQTCGYKTDCRIAMTSHKQNLHFIGRRYQCTYCPEFDTNEFRITKHIINQHGVHPNPPELGASNAVQCPICEEDFHYKVQRDHHLKMCRKDIHKLRTIQTGRAPVDINMINRWLWDKPPTEPSILQQEAQQRQQQLRQQQLVLEQQKTQRQQAAAAAAFVTTAHNLTSNKQSYQINKQQQQTQQRLFPAIGQQQKPGSGGFDPVAAKAMAIRLGKEQQQTAAAFLAASQRQHQMSAVGMALTTGIGGGAGTSGSGTQGAKQPSVGEILKMAKDRAGTNLKMTPQVLQAVMALQMQKNQQVQQKSQQILAAAAAANRSLGYAGISAAAAKLTTGPAAIRQKQQMGTTTVATLSRGKPPKMPSTIAAPPQLERQAQPQKQLQQTCEICDTQSTDKDQYRIHLQQAHRQLLGKTASDMVQGAPLACSRCRERFWTYEGLERHLVMSHGLVTSDLLAKAQRKQDSGRCKLCGKSYGFNILQHLVTEHQVKLCSAEIMYSCDMCAFRCASYQKLESHLAEKHHSKNMAN